MGQEKAHWRWQTARQRVQSRRDSSWLWWRVHLPLVRSTLRTLAQARLHQSARSIRGPRAPTYVCTGNRLCFSGVDHVLSRSPSLSHSLSLSSSPTSLVRPNRHAPHHDRHPAFLSLSLSPVPDKLLACPSPSSLRLQLPRRLAPRDFLRSPISLHDRSSHASLFRATLYFPSSRRSLVPIRVVAA